MGKRYPSGEALARIDRTYGISPRDLDLDPVEFAQRLADPDRTTYTAQMLDRIQKSHAARVKQLRSERLCPSKRRRSRECPGQESNLRTRFRRALLYPLSYRGSTRYMKHSALTPSVHHKRPVLNRCSIH